jgi:hypothetical protein
MHLGHVVGRQENGIVARGVEVPVRAVDDPHLWQLDAAFRPEVTDAELMLDRLRLRLRLRLGLLRPRWRVAGEKRECAECRPDEPAERRS